MTSAARKILEATLALDEPERSELVSALSESLASGDVVLSPAWNAEIERRISELAGC